MFPLRLYRTISNIPPGTKLSPAKFFKSFYVEENLLHDVLKEQPEKKYFLGTIPRVFFTEIKREEIPEVAMKIRELFASFAKNLSEISIYKKGSVSRILSLKEFLENLSNQNTNSAVSPDIIINSFKENLATLIKQNIKLEQLGDGTIGQAFKLTIKDKDFTVKSFAPIYEGLRLTFRSFLEKLPCSHGGKIEPILAAFITHKSGTGISPRFYFGKIAYNNNNDGYLVSRYVNKNSVPQIKNIAFLHMASPIEFIDVLIHPDWNHINGIVYDFGGAKLKQHYPNDRETAKFIRKLCALADKGDVIKCKEFLDANASNPKCKDAIEYIKKEAWKNELYDDCLYNKEITDNQKEVLSIFGVEKFKSEGM